MNIYGFYDKTAKKMRIITMNENDGLVIRENAKSIAQIFPLGDIEIRKLGTIDEQEGNITEIYESRDVNNIISWDSYEFPESPFQKVDKKEKKEK